MTSAITTALQDAALDYVGRGWALTWIPYGQKGPNHKDWQTPAKVVTTPDAARQRWNGTALNIGLVHGLGTVRTCSFDEDHREHTALVFEALGIDLESLLEGIPTVQGRGRRFLFRVPDGIDLKAVKLEWPNPNGGLMTLFELRAGACQDVLPPSLHPSGKQYEWIHPLPADPADHPEPPPALLELWRNWESWKPELVGLCPWSAPTPEPQPRPHRPADGANLDVIGQFNLAHGVRALLEAHGYRARGKSRYLPPNSTSGVPSVRVLDSGKVYSNNGSCPLNDGHAHDAFSVFLHLEHRGDMRGAVKAAAALLGIELKGRERQEPPRPAPAVPAAVPAAAAGLDPYRGTDDANADLFLHLHGQDVRYCPPWERWLLWSGSHWRIDDRLDIDRLAADVTRELYRRAADADDRQRRAIVELARKLERTALRSTMLIAARHRVVVHHADLDQGRFLLNCRNGTVDLTTGRLRHHARADLLTHDTEIEYHPTAAAPTWLSFLHTVFAGDADLIDFVQRAVGYSLTGDVREQVLLLCHGSGSNGKSVFLNILRKLLGRLALQAAPDLLLQDKSRRHPTEQADLFGKRLVVCQETGEGRRFNETLVKQLTGGDAIRARRMHEDFWEFEPTHKIWLSTNHRPEIKGMDYAIWRRMRLIPFLQRFHNPGEGEPVKDPDMEHKLMAELPGILAWAVQGCLAWQREGLKQAEAVKQATAAYQAEMDVLAGWIADCCVIHRNAKARASALYRSYSEWCGQSGEHPESQRRWGMRLTERGFHRYSNDGIWYRGIGIRTEGTEVTEGEKAYFPREINTSSKYVKSSSVGSVPSVNPADDPADTNALLSLLMNGGSGASGACLRDHLGWSDEQFNRVKADLLAQGRIRYEQGGWHLVGGAA